MARTPTPRTTDTERLRWIGDATAELRSAAIDMDDGVTTALFSVFPSVRNHATCKLVVAMTRCYLRLADVQRVMLSRDFDDPL